MTMHKALHSRDDRFQEKKKEENSSVLRTAYIPQYKKYCNGAKKD